MQYKNDKTLLLRKTLGEKIKKQREIKAFSCNGMENAFGFSSGSVFKIENGIVDCKFMTFWKIAEALDIKPSELLKQIENELGKNFKLIEE